jgi:hypothetical protein
MHRLEQAFKHSYPSITYLNLSIAYCPALAVEVAGEWRLR